MAISKYYCCSNVMCCYVTVVTEKVINIKLLLIIMW